jgi:hypothetical protein
LMAARAGDAIERIPASAMATASILRRMFELLVRPFAAAPGVHRTPGSFGTTLS